MITAVLRIALALWLCHSLMARADDDSLAALKAQFQRPATVPHPDNNPYSPAKFALGQRLFFDPRLSRDNDISCASCHAPATGWEDGRQRAVGSDAQIHERHSPALENLAWASALLWDGRTPTLESQVWFPLTAHDEMAQDVRELQEELQADAAYVAAFDAAYPGKGISLITVSAAIATFQREIVSPPAPFDHWVAGDETAISDEAKQGFALFTGKAGCNACHSGWRLTDDGFHDTGLPASDDSGRYRFSRDDGDRNAFKTPGLRNLARRAPYMHDGSLATLDDVLAHFNGGFTPRPSLSPKMRHPALADGELNALRAFLDTLNSDGGSALPTARPD
ncbi:cytochrome-c peroxidase [Parahaliea mediterranea]|uniref:cytochrome-c peroxidase n=1 Tax=Parahaliea mediterranea TaxID=651086 RepID=UPI000E2F20C2|nr:cytochrome c peroxidase [Parahaliea mediterranea]